MQGVNRALKNQIPYKSIRLAESIGDNDVPCIFISYQREDERFAQKVADYIISKNMDVYFDLEDNDLKFTNQEDDPENVTQAIKKGLKNSNYMLVVISPTTFKSFWVPFEIGYAFDDKGSKMKLLRHKEIHKNTLPAYLKTKELLQGTKSLDSFLESIRSNYPIYEGKLHKEVEILKFEKHSNNPLTEFLANE